MKGLLKEDLFKVAPIHLKAERSDIGGGWLPDVG